MQNNHVIESITGKRWYAGDISTTKDIHEAVNLGYWQAYKLMKELNGISLTGIRWTVKPIGSRLTK